VSSERSRQCSLAITAVLLRSSIWKNKQKESMIFGFNTDVKQGNTVYHVQSEARKGDLLLQTMVFVKGHCIGKYASSYAEQVGDPGFSEEHIHDLLKDQHREVLEAVKAGSIEQFFRDQTEIRDAEGESLALTWLNSDETPTARKIVMRLLVSDAGNGLDGALVTSRLQYPAGVPIHSQAVSESDGRAELPLDLAQMDSKVRDLVVFVRATHGERSVTRKYRLRQEMRNQQ
jgi:hypothetical protein